MVEDALRAANLPYRIVGGLRFYDRAEIKDLLAYLRVIAAPEDDVSLLRILNVPTRGIGKTTIDAIEKFAAARSVSMFEALNGEDLYATLNFRAGEKIREFVKMMRDYDDIDHKILRIEQRVEAASEHYEEELKKIRVSLKDKLYKMLVAAK